MPTIRRFANCKISIYADDHLPPHFHIEGRGFKAPEALKWARDNIGLLRTEWNRLNRRA
jgi:hypothetical protein